MRRKKWGGGGGGGRGRAVVRGPRFRILGGGGQDLGPPQYSKPSYACGGGASKTFEVQYKSVNLPALAQSFITVINWVSQLCFFPMHVICLTKVYVHPSLP